ncbi:DUF4335 domain-containing protein [Synechocystis sp. B12]|nr:DUF4335 domain-containing protein [Synechocystis sp. B12]
MNIQRPYRLPNCTLTLEGMTSGTDPSSTNGDLQIILNARCQFLSTNQSLEGAGLFWKPWPRRSTVTPRVV